MCGNKNPGDANTYLNEPKSHPQTRPQKTKPEGCKYLEQTSNEDPIHCNDKIQDNFPPVKTLDRRDTGGPGEAENRRDHHIPHTR